MRLARICISVVALTLGSLVVSATGAAAVSPCPPGQPPGRPPGSPPGSPPGQPPGRPPAYPPGRCQLRLNPSSTTAGSPFTATGGGYQPRSQVALTFDSVPLGTAAAAGGGGIGRSVPLLIGTVLVPVGTSTTDSVGTFAQTISVPSGTAPGSYNVLATGVDPNGEPYELTAILQVVAANTGSGGSGGSGSGNGNGNGPNNGKASGAIPRTGTTPAAPLAAGLALTAAGAVLMVAAKRRKLNLA